MLHDMVCAEADDAAVDKADLRDVCHLRGTERQGPPSLSYIFHGAGEEKFM